MTHRVIVDVLPFLAVIGAVAWIACLYGKLELERHRRQALERAFQKLLDSRK